MENKRWMWLVGGLVLLSMAVASGGEVWEESDHEVLIRSERGAKNRENCRYTKSGWSECDPKTNVRARTLTLKKGDPASCERTKTIQKKCKKACRYEKSSWSECSPNGEMSRTDMLKANSDPTCDKSRRVTKKCNKNKQVKTSKDKGRAAAAAEATCHTWEREIRARYLKGAFTRCNKSASATRRRNRQ